MGDGASEKQAQGEAGRRARDESYAKRRARIEERGGSDCAPPVKQAKGYAASAGRELELEVKPACKIGIGSRGYD